MFGILNIDKPAGMTSRQVVDVVGRAAGTRQVGHAGTLDPLATGVLIVCVGWTTRLVPYIQRLPKVYRAEFLLGRTSDTDDVTGTIIEQQVAGCPPREEVESQLSRFVGRIVQTPPAFSAVRVGGERAYKLARRGEQVAPEPREVDVHSLRIVEYEFPKLTVEIACGSGTYVRAIGRDLGEALGCGAVMSGLVREAIGEFRRHLAISLDSLSTKRLPELLLAPRLGTAALAECVCTADEEAAVRQGKVIPRGAITRNEEDANYREIALVRDSGDLIAIAEFQAAKNGLQPRQVFPSAEK